MFSKSTGNVSIIVSQIFNTPEEKIPKNNYHGIIELGNVRDSTTRRAIELWFLVVSVNLATSLQSLVAPLHPSSVKVHCCLH